MHQSAGETPESTTPLPTRVEGTDDNERIPAEDLRIDHPSPCSPEEEVVWFAAVPGASGGSDSGVSSRRTAAGTRSEQIVKKAGTSSEYATQSKDGTRRERKVFFDDRWGRPGSTMVPSPTTGKRPASGGTAAWSRSEVTPTVHVLALGLLHVYLSTLNAAQWRAWNISTFRNYVFAASSLLEIIGFATSVVSCFANGREVRYLGQPLLVIAAGMMDDNSNSRTVGFRGTVVQAAVSALLFVVFVCSAGNYWAIGVVPFVMLVLAQYIQVTVSAENEGRGFLHPQSSLSRRVKVLAYGSLPFSPVVIGVLESALLLRSFSVDHLLLVVCDVLAVAPAIAWFVLEAFNVFTPRPLAILASHLFPQSH